MPSPPPVPAAWTALPRLPLLAGATPLTEAPRLAAHLRAIAETRARHGPHTVWLKREDLAPVGLGGNKVRNLELLLGDALAAGADSVVTAGRRWSNHARLTAAAAALAGLDAHLVLTGPEPAEPGPGATLAVAHGATLHWTTGGERAERDGLVAQVAADLRRRGRTPVVIGVGGTGPLGAVAQTLAALEMIEQARSVGTQPEIVVLASATGGTQAGLIAGLALAGVASRVVGAAVARSPDELRPTVAALTSGLAADAGLTDPPALELVDARGRGYGYAWEAATTAAGALARCEGVPADPIYTAKALAVLFDLARTGELDGRTVVFWHGGGTPGLFEALEG